MQAFSIMLNSRLVQRQNRNVCLKRCFQQTFTYNLCNFHDINYQNTRWFWFPPCMQVLACFYSTNCKYKSFKQKDTVRELFAVLTNQLFVLIELSTKLYQRQRAHPFNVRLQISVTSIRQRKSKLIPVNILFAVHKIDACN